MNAFNNDTTEKRKGQIENCFCTVNTPARIKKSHYERYTNTNFMLGWDHKDCLQRISLHGYYGE